MQCWRNTGEKEAAGLRKSGWALLRQPACVTWTRAIVTIAETKRDLRGGWFALFQKRTIPVRSAVETNTGDATLILMPTRTPYI